MANAISRAQIIHTAMEQAGGNATAAAEALGMPVKNLHKILLKVTWLRARWTLSKANLKEANPFAAAIYRPTTDAQIETLTPGKAVDMIDGQLRNGFAAFGLTGPELENALAIQNTMKRQVRGALDLMAGSVVKRFLSLNVEIERISDRLAAGELEFVEEEMLRNDRARLMEIQGKQFHMVQRAKTEEAALQLKAQAAAAGGKTKIKPGFAPLEKPGKPEEPIDT
jgi:hypothetical protein